LNNRIYQQFATIGSVFVRAHNADVTELRA